MRAESPFGSGSILAVCVVVTALAAGTGAVLGGRPALGGGVIAMTVVAALALRLRTRRVQDVGPRQVQTGYGVAFSVLGAAALVTGATGPGVVLVLCAAWIWCFTGRTRRAP
jgi:hypothetical protein